MLEIVIGSNSLRESFLRGVPDAGRMAGSTTFMNYCTSQVSRNTGSIDVGAVFLVKR